MPSCNKAQDCQNGKPKSQGIKPSHSPERKLRHPIHHEKEQAGENDFCEDRHPPIMDPTEASRKAVAAVYSWRKDIDDWMSYVGGDSYGFGTSGDLLAVSKQGVVKPRQLAIIKRKGDQHGMVCIYLGGIFPDEDDVSTGCALFCDFRACDGSDELPSVTIPFVEFQFIARVLGTASVDKPWRSLERWKLPKREREMIKRIEATLQPVVSPIQAFDIDRMRGNTSVH
jgi:hypothetical protein